VPPRGYQSKRFHASQQSIRRNESLRRGKRSQIAEKSFANDATLSAIPSMNPAFPDPRDRRQNAGSTQYAIRCVSFRKELAPKT